MVKKQKKLEEVVNNWKKALADYQNLEKRVAQERKSWVSGANKDLILRILPVLDTLMLANKHVKNEGLTLSIKQFTDVLKDEGVERIATQDRIFDPTLMECVATEEGEDGRVVEEVRAGYVLHGKVLRAAQVKVGKKAIQEKEEALAQKELQKGDYM